MIMGMAVLADAMLNVPIFILFYLFIYLFFASNAHLYVPEALEEVVHALI